MAQLAADGSTFDTSRGEWADTCNGITVLKKKKPFTFVLGQGISAFPPVAWCCQLLNRVLNEWSGV